MTINLDMGHALSGADTGAVKRVQINKILLANKIVRKETWRKLL